MKATFVKDMEVAEYARGTQKLWKLSEPVKDQDNNLHQYVITSAVSFNGACETYIFPAKKDGTVKSWLELPGSFRGDMDHERAITNAGWEVEK